MIRCGRVDCGSVGAFGDSQEEKGKKRGRSSFVVSIWIRRMANGNRAAPQSGVNHASPWPPQAAPSGEISCVPFFWVAKRGRINFPGLAPGFPQRKPPFPGAFLDGPRRSRTFAPLFNSNPKTVPERKAPWVAALDQPLGRNRRHARCGDRANRSGIKCLRRAADHMENARGAWKQRPYVAQLEHHRTAERRRDIERH